MADKVTPRAWFGRKTFGWGLRPVSWQGWTLTACYLLLVLLIAHALAKHHAVLFVAALVVVTVAYATIALATRGDE